MKKVLSWVLALALVLSSFSMAFAGDLATASTMKDADKIANKEAVDVMVATGIIGGYPDGGFYPEKTVTRAEMAKMISVAVNGGEDVGPYYASSCTFADSKNHWGAGYIAYCANEGIIDGRSADVFDPDATVTGTEAAKMILVALGYDAKIEKLTGEAWSANVLKLAKANDLFDGMTKGFVAGTPLSRDNAAQLIFNGLNADMVAYAFDAEISTGDTTITVNTKVGLVAAGITEDTNEDGILQLYESAFNKDLVKKEKAQSDDFGRPAHKWELEKEEIGTYTDTPAYTFVVSDDESLNDALKAYDEELYDEFVGSSADKKITAAVCNGEANNDEVWLGDVVELYDLDKIVKDENDKEYDSYKAVILTYELYTIEEVDKEVSDKDAKDGVSAYVTIDGVPYKDTEIPGYDEKAYVKDAVIAVAYDYPTGKNEDDVIIDSYVPKKVTGELTKYYAGSTYIDGTKYNNGTGWTVTSPNPDLEIGNEYDFYFINDYIYEAVEVTDNNPYKYAIYLGYKIDGGYSNDDAVYSVKLFTAEGKTETFIVEDDEVNGFTVDRDAVTSPQANALIAYTLNSDKEIDFISVAPADRDFDKEMKTNGILNGKRVASDVVAFSYDDVDKEWSVYDYDALKAAESVEAETYHMNRDGDEMAAIKLANPLEDTTNDVYGFVTNIDDEAKNADKKEIYVITALIDGKEVTLETTSRAGINYNENDGPLTLYKFTLNKDNAIVALNYASCFGVNEISDDFDVYDVAFMTNNNFGQNTLTSFNPARDILTITEKSGTLLDVGENGNKDFQSVDGAVFYQVEIVEDRDAEGGYTYKVKLATLRDVKKGYEAALFQTDEDASAWNIVVFVNPADIPQEDNGGNGNA